MTDNNAAASSAAEVAHSNNVYILSKDHAWIPARVIESNDTTAEVSIPLYKDEQAIQSDGGKASKGSDRQTIVLQDYSNKALPLQNVDEKGNLNEVEDMVDLPFLHEVCMCLPYNIAGRSLPYRMHTSRTHDSNMCDLKCSSLFVLGCHFVQSQISPCPRKAIHKNR